MSTTRAQIYHCIEISADVLKQCVEPSRKLFPVSTCIYQQSICHTSCYFIFEVIYRSTFLDVHGSTIFLKLLCFAVKYVKCLWCSNIMASCCGCDGSSNDCIKHCKERGGLLNSLSPQQIRGGYAVEKKNGCFPNLDFYQFCKNVKKNQQTRKKCGVLQASLCMS